MPAAALWPRGSRASRVGGDEVVEVAGGRAVDAVERLLHDGRDLGEAEPSLEEGARPPPRWPRCRRTARSRRARPASRASGEHREDVVVDGLERRGRGPRAAAAATSVARALRVGERVGDRNAHVGQRRGARGARRRGSGRANGRSEVGCTTTSIRSIGTPKSQWASISSSPLFASVAESIVIFGPMRHVGCASASSGVTPSSSARERPRNGPPEAVRTSPTTRVRRSRPSRHWWSAECSLSTGTIVPPPRSRARTASSPAATRLSLFASASVTPCSSAQSVARMPAKPTTALSTTSGVLRSRSGVGSPPTWTCSTPCSAASASSGERAGLERTELELGMRGDDVDRLPADRACRTEQATRLTGGSMPEDGVQIVLPVCAVTSTRGAPRTPPARPRGASRAGRGRRRDRPAGCRSP